MKKTILEILGTLTLVFQAISVEPQIITIGNPTYDLTFKDLLGPKGAVVDGIDGKGRLISFINSVYDDDITDIEYIDITSEHPYTKKMVFDIACKCYDKDHKNIYDIEIQRGMQADFIDRTVMYGARLLSDNLESRSYWAQPHVRVLSLLNHVLDKEKPGIFHGKIIDPEAREVLRDVISWTYVQLPILRQNGTDNRWLWLMSQGATMEQYIDLDASESASEDPVYNSGVRLLESYTSNGRRAALQAEARAIADGERLINTVREEGVAIGREEGVAIGINKAHANSILNLRIKLGMGSDQIADALGMQPEFVQLVIAIAELSHSYLDYCSEHGEEPDYGVFLTKAKQKFNVTENDIEAVVNSGDE